MSNEATIGVTRDKRSGLLLPFWRCEKCTSDRCYRDPKGGRRCWNCQPPHQILRILKEEKIARLKAEQSAVDHFLDEDEDIQMYNLRHFGRKTS